MKRLSHRAFFKVIPSFLAGMLLQLTAASPVRAEDLSQAEITSGWLNLYDGSLFGWNATGSWTRESATLAAPAGAEHRLMYALPFGDFELRFMFRVSERNSGAALRLRTTLDGTPPDAGFRIPLADGDPNWLSGSIVNKAHATTTASPSSWHSMEVDASGAKVTVKIDGQLCSTAEAAGVRAGYLGFENGAAAELTLRDLHLRPKNFERLFDGTDLANWKNVPFVKSAKNGVLHPVEKIFGGGGSPKPHLAQWSVNEGRIVGAKGPGALESTGTYQDFILQVTAGAKGGKANDFPAFYIRNDAGKLFTGYAVGIGPEVGRVRGFGEPRHPLAPKVGSGSAAGEEQSETLIAAGRNFGIFMNGLLVTLAIDPRAEGAETGAVKTSAGTLSLNSGDGDGTVTYHNLAIAPLTHPFGKLVQPEAPAVPSPNPIAAAPKPAVPPAAETQTAQTAQTAQIAQTEQLAAALGVINPQDRAKTASLMSSAIRSTDPQEQMNLYNQVIQIDPANAAAVQGYKEAKTRLDTQQAAAATSSEHRQTEQATQQSTQQQVAEAQTKARSQFLGGNLREASRTLSIAERLAPGNPVTSALRSRIASSLALRSRFLYFGTGTGIIAVIGLLWLWRGRRRSQRSPILEMTRGLTPGRVFQVSKDITRIGAVAQDGGQRNDIVVEDVEHMISRFHCELHRKEGRFFLIDSGSSNGTRVDGRTATPRTPAQVRKGSRIDLAGTVEFRLGFERKRRGA